MGGKIFFSSSWAFCSRKKLLQIRVIYPFILAIKNVSHAEEFKG